MIIGSFARTRPVIDVELTRGREEGNPCQRGTTEPMYYCDATRALHGTIAANSENRCPQGGRIVRGVIAILTIVGFFIGTFGATGAEPRKLLIITGYFPAPHDKVCAATEIFVAEILSAVLKDPNASTCHPRDQLTFRTRVDEMLAMNGRELAVLKLTAPQPNDELAVVADLFNSRPTDSEGKYPPKDEFGTLKADPPTGEPLSDAQISQQLIGRTFIIGIRPNPFAKTHPPVASVWTMNLRQWVENQIRLSAGFCSTLVGQDKPPWAKFSPR